MTTLLQNTRDVGSSAYFGENGDWLIAAAVHRDSGTIDRSNFTCFEQALKALPEFAAWEGEFQPVTVERFNHWAVGWVDYLIVDPAFVAGVKMAESIREGLEDYPVLSDEHLSELESAEANQVWRDCYQPEERVKYVREHRSQFEFHDFRDMLGCLRGKYFAGYASELLS